MKRKLSVVSRIGDANFIYLFLFLICLLLRVNTLSMAQPGMSPENSVAAFVMNEKVMGHAAVINPMIDIEEYDTFELGCEFTVEFPITVTELGLYDLNADGIDGTTRVTIWSTVDHSPLLTVEIPDGVEATLINGFRYVDVVDMRLQPGTYIMSAFIEGEGHGMNTGLTAQTGRGITLTAGVYNSDPGYPVHYNYSYGFFGANFLYTADEPAVVEIGTVDEITATWELGCSFTVNDPILLTHLGTYDVNGDGLAVETPVTIWRVSDQSAVATCNIPAGETAYMINNFRYMKIEPILLEPGQYRMSSYFVSDGYARNNTATSLSVPEITLTGGAFAVSHAYPSNSNASYYFGANFLFTTPLAAIVNPLIESDMIQTWELGNEFEVNSPVTVAELGTYDRLNDGLTVETIVTLWNTTDQSIILRDTIPSGTEAHLINGFRYIDIPDFYLQPGIYRISSYFVSDGFGWNSSQTSTSVSEITIISGVYVPANAQGYPSSTATYYYYGPNFLLKQSCAAADLPVIDGSALICSGESVTLSIAEGYLNDSEHWQWHLGSCNGISLGTGNSIIISPTGTISYSVNGEGNCLNEGPCAVDTVEVVNNVSITREGNTLVSSINGAEYQWVDCNNGNAPITGETNPSYTPAQNGDYAVYVTIGGCVLESTCTHFTITGLRQNTFGPGLSTYPNPVHEMLIIDLPDACGQITLEIADLQGQVIVRKTYRSDSHLEVAFSEFDTGIYFLRIYTADQMATLKILKE